MNTQTPPPIVRDIVRTIESRRAITLDWAYGGVKVCRMIGSGGGEAGLSMRGTMREAATFLDAMLTGIKIEQGNRK